MAEQGFVLLTGDVASVDAAVAAGCEVAAEEGILTGRAVIAGSCSASSCNFRRGRR